MNDQDTSLDKQFVYWQCQIRKHSMRNLLGKPTSGFCPEMIVDGQSLGVITVLLVPESPQHDISHLQHVYKKTFDPKIRREQALKYLQSEFYQVPGAFNGELTALAGVQSTWADDLLKANKIQLNFKQDSRQWQLLCNVQRLHIDDPRWQFTLTHNRLFNHTLTTEVDILLFDSDWSKAVVT